MLVIRMASVIQQTSLIYLENKRIAYEFLNNGNITIIKLIVNLIMCGFSRKCFNAAFITPVLLQYFLLKS